MLNFRLWLQGLIAAAVTGGAHSITNYLVDPSLIDSHAGLIKLGKLVGLSTILSVAAYLYKSPIPSQESNVDYSNVQKEQLEKLIKSANDELAKRSKDTILTTN